MEHRWGHRQDIDRSVHVCFRGGVLVRARIRNVSTSGAYVLSELPVSLFSYVKISFVGIRRGQRVATQIEGQIVRRDSRGFGVEWNDFAPEALQALTCDPPRRMPVEMKGQAPQLGRRHHLGRPLSSK